jgi:predicted amidophosphoribosyltransferase
MSLPDYLLNPEPDDQCENCHAQARRGRRLCAECMADLTDLYADEAIEDLKERGR